MWQISVEYDSYIDELCELISIINLCNSLKFITVGLEW